MDIKYIHVHGTGRNALLLTAPENNSYIQALHSNLQMLSLMLLEYKAEGMSLKNDNGSQFIATAVREYLK